MKSNFHSFISHYFQPLMHRHAFVKMNNNTFIHLINDYYLNFVKFENSRHLPDKEFFIDYGINALYVPNFLVNDLIQMQPGCRLTIPVNEAGKITSTLNLDNNQSEVNSQLDAILIKLEMEVIPWMASSSNSSDLIYYSQELPYRISDRCWRLIYQCYLHLWENDTQQAQIKLGMVKQMARNEYQIHQLNQLESIMATVNNYKSNLLSIVAERKLLLKL